MRATIGVMPQLQAGSNVGQDGKGGMENLRADECEGDAAVHVEADREIVVGFPIDRAVRAKQISGVVQGEAPQRQGQTRGTRAREKQVILEGATARDKPGGLRVEIDDEDGSKKGCSHRRQATRDARHHHWGCVVEGRREIGTSRFGPAVVGIGGNVPGGAEEDAWKARARQTPKTPCLWRGVKPRRSRLTFFATKEGRLSPPVYRFRARDARSAAAHPVSRPGPPHTSSLASSSIESAACGHPSAFGPTGSAWNGTPTSDDQARGRR